jgi:hypothetical protein
MIPHTSTFMNGLKQLIDHYKPERQKEAATIVWVALFDNQRVCNKYIQFHILPIVGQECYSCIPDEILSFDSAAELAEQLIRGAIDGWIQGYRWYRQVKPPSMDKDTEV